jgi:mono/diheme cytochrome c family protein
MRRFSVGMLTVLIMASVVLMNSAALAQTAAVDGKKLKNPAKATPESVAAGQKLFAKSCSVCHGQSGKGDGAIVKSLKPEATKPSNLADDKWDHGSTDGEIFVAIRDGIGPKFEMKAQKGKLMDQDMWNLVNYIRSLNSKPKS